jgi:hypothetical protein
LQLVPQLRNLLAASRLSLVIRKPPAHDVGSHHGHASVGDAIAGMDSESDRSIACLCDALDNLGDCNIHVTICFEYS